MLRYPILLFLTSFKFQEQHNQSVSSRLGLNLMWNLHDLWWGAYLTGDSPRSGGQFHPTIQELCAGGESKWPHVFIQQDQWCPCLRKLPLSHSNCSQHMGLWWVWWWCSLQFQNPCTPASNKTDGSSLWRM